MHVKKNIIAPIVLTLGSLSVAAGTVAPIVASTAAGTVVASSSSPGGIGRMG